MFQGYTSAAGDGGQGGISGGGSVPIFDGAFQNVHFIDLHMHNTGANYIMRQTTTGTSAASMVRCEIDNCTGDATSVGAYGGIYACTFHNIGGIAASGAVDTKLMYCYFYDDGGNDMTMAVTGFSNCLHNVINLSGGGDGIAVALAGSFTNYNTLYSSSGTGLGIQSYINTYMGIILNNYVEGFATNFNLINPSSSKKGVAVLAGNASYNGATADFNIEAGHAGIDYWGSTTLTDSNEILTASALNNAGSSLFNTVTEGSVQEGSIPDNIGNGSLA